MRSPEHHTKSPNKSQYGKALDFHNPKWPLNFNNLLYLGMAYLSDSIEDIPTIPPGQHDLA